MSDAYPNHLICTNFITNVNLLISFSLSCPDAHDIQDTDQQDIAHHTQHAGQRHLAAAYLVPCHLRATHTRSRSSHLTLINWPRGVSYRYFRDSDAEAVAEVKDLDVKSPAVHVL